MAMEWVLCEDGVTEQGLRVRTLTLNRAAKANALTAQMMERLGAVVGEQAADAHVLQSASGKTFCAGADIAEFIGRTDALAVQENVLRELIRQFSYSSVPLIVVASGKASGAGALLIALADVVLAAESLEVACPEIRFGMYPVMVEAVLQSRLAPALAARICMGQPLDAHEAHRAGLVTEVLPSAGFDVLVAQRLAFYLERNAGLQVARRTRLRQAEQLLRQVDEVAPLMAENFSSHGVRERIASYLANLGAVK